MFRRTQVFVGDHIPPHADHIEVLMKSFIAWLNSPEAIGNNGFIDIHGRESWGIFMSF